MTARKFQCSSASRKFLNCAVGAAVWYMRRRGFSALQRAENSSIKPRRHQPRAPERFSALQRAENSSIQRGTANDPDRPSFSALQRAENSSITRDKLPELVARLFQCSSASRKFLNRSVDD